MKEEVAISEKTIKDETPNRLAGFDGQKTPDGFEYPAVPEGDGVDEVKANQ